MDSVSCDALFLDAMDKGVIVIAGGTVFRTYVTNSGSKIRVRKKSRLNRDGYAVMDFWGIGGRRIKTSVHRLIWLWNYCAPVPEGHNLHHLDGDKQNNIIDNLKALTIEEHGRISMVDLPEF